MVLKKRGGHSYTLANSSLKTRLNTSTQNTGRRELSVRQEHPPHVNRLCYLPLKTTIGAWSIPFRDVERTALTARLINMLARSCPCCVNSLSRGVCFNTELFLDADNSWSCAVNSSRARALVHAAGANMRVQSGRQASRARTASLMKQRSAKLKMNTGKGCLAVILSLPNLEKWCM